MRSPHLRTSKGSVESSNPHLMIRRLLARASPPPRLPLRGMLRSGPRRYYSSSAARNLRSLVTPATCAAVASGIVLSLSVGHADHTPSRAEAAPSAPSARSSKVDDDYELGAEVGSGCFAVVRRGRCRRTGKEVAIKVIRKSKQTDESVRQECGVLQRVSMHRCIASLEAFYEDLDCFYIVMEYVDGGDVFERLLEHGAHPTPSHPTRRVASFPPTRPHVIPSPPQSRRFLGARSCESVAGGWGGSGAAPCPGAMPR